MATSPSNSLSISIVGSGIAGLASAINIAKLPAAHQITIHEIRPQPSTIGGAVNLTPNALRNLSRLGVLDTIRAKRYGADVSRIELFDFHSAAALSAINFGGPGGKGHGTPPLNFKALRILRGEMMEAMLETAAKYPNISIRYDQKLTSITESAGGVTLGFASGEETNADLVLGCDGIHSAARTLLVDPDRQPKYSGIAVAFAFSPLPTQNTSTTGNPSTTQPLFFTDTSLCSSRRGSLMSSFYTPARTSIYIGGIMETASVSSRDGWKALGADQAAVRADITSRFADPPAPGALGQQLATLIQNAGDWNLYPVFTLPPKGQWRSPAGRVVLLGDAAHAMAPQGEAAGIALEDAVIFSRLMGFYSSSSAKHGLTEIGDRYEAIRRPVVDKAYDEAQWRWETVKDSGAWVHWLKSCVLPWWVWWTEGKRARGFAEDVWEMDLGLD